jgi:hypothetical protein
VYLGVYLCRWNDADRRLGRGPPLHDATTFLSIPRRSKPFRVYRDALWTTVSGFESLPSPTSPFATIAYG